MINRFIPILQVIKSILLKIGITDYHFSLGYVTKGVKNKLVWLYIRIIDKEKSEKCFPPSVFSDLHLTAFIFSLCQEFLFQDNRNQSRCG